MNRKFLILVMAIQNECYFLNHSIDLSQQTRDQWQNLSQNQNQTQNLAVAFHYLTIIVKI